MANTAEKLKRGTNAALLAALTIGSIALVNVIGLRYFARADLTEEKIYSLSEASIDIVKGLDDTIRVKAYFNNELPPPFNQNARYLREMLDEFRAYSKGKMRYEFIDPAGDEDLKQELQQLGVPEVDVQVARDDKFEATRVFMGVVLHYGDKHETIPYVRNTANLEYNITSLIKRLTRERVPVLGLVRGHEEPEMQEQLGTIAQLIGQQYELREVDTTTGEIPGDVDALLFIKPKTAFSDAEKYAIDQFIMKGKPAGFLLDTVDTDMQQFTATEINTGLEDMLSHYGAEPRKALVQDVMNARINVSRRQGFMIIQQTVEYPYFPLLARIEETSVLTKGLANLSFPFVSAIDLKVDEDGPVRGEKVLATTEKSWVAEGEYNIHPFALEDNVPEDFDGPFTLAATLKGQFTSFFKDKAVPAAEGEQPPAAPEKEKSAENRILVIGDGDFVRDEFLARDRVKQVFFQNIIDWLLSDEGLISMRGRAVTEQPLEETEPGDRSFIRIANLLGVPLAFIAFGIVRWRVRQSRRRSAIL